MRYLFAAPIVLMLAGCAGGHDFALSGPVAAPPKPVFVQTRVTAPDRAPEVDFIHASGSNSVFFATDSAALEARARDTLVRQAEWLISHPEISIKIEGHADERSDAGYNRNLGLKRAKAVVDYLTARGVSYDRFKVISYGETKPLIAAKGDIEANRRVVTVLIN